MKEPPPPGPGQENQGRFNTESGLKGDFAAFADGAKRYLGARAELLAIEGREAGEIFSRKIVYLIAGVFFSLVGYLMFAVTSVGILGRFIDPDIPLSLWNWMGAAMILGIVHLIFAAFCFSKSRKIGAGIETFEYTRAEWKKDQEWIESEKKS